MPTTADSTAHVGHLFDLYSESKGHYLIKQSFSRSVNIYFDSNWVSPCHHQQPSCVVGDKEGVMSFPGKGVGS